MYILIVTATSLEIKPLIDNFEFIQRKESNLNAYKYRDFDIDVLITGIGMVATAYYLGKTLQSYQYDIAINAGIAGCFDKNIGLGEVFNIISDSFSELGAENGEYFLSLVDLKLIEEDSFPFSNLELLNESIIKSEIVNHLIKVKGITVNTIHGNEENIEKIKSRFNPVTESMEGAAFMYACKLQYLKYIQIRSVSNYVEKRNKESWNIALAIKNLNNILIKILDE
ncbi:MAG: futalosine hydrolase [Bacteroidetes bacterium]|nr:futalosine hydrolase [Bacteroidota bacterium]